MDKTGYVNKLRLFLSDPEGHIWDEVELNTILDEALKQYCKDSGAFTGRFDFYPDSDGKYHYPEDYSGFMIGWNKVGHEITPATARELFTRSHRNANRTGEAEYIFDDRDLCGNFSLYPSPEQNSRSITVTPENGEIFDNSYGVFLTDGYGTTLSVDSFDFAGTVYYRKTGRFEDVKDYMAVICYALYLSYNIDSEFANAELAIYWKNMYKSRLAVFGRVVHNNTGRTVSGNFF